MNALARAMLRPALLAARSSAHASAAAVVCATGSGSLAQHFPKPRHWSSAPDEATIRKAEKMVEMMGQSPQLQQMMLSAMPSFMRNPETIKQLFSDPAMKRKIAEMIAQRGMTIPDHLLERMSPSSMDDTFSRAQRVGLDPGTMFQKLMAHPGLLSALQQPRVMAAFLDISEDPSRQSKYEGDKELLDVVFKVREIMGTSKASAPGAAPGAGSTIPVASTVAESAAAPSPPPPSEAASSSSASASSSSSSGWAAAPMPPPPGQPPQAAQAEEASASASASSSDAGSDAGSGSPGFNPLVTLLASDPKSARWLQNPQVMAALEEVHKKPWKTVKYIFNREVMEAFQDLKKLLRGQKP